jgi:hypothetical protein
MIKADTGKLLLLLLLFRSRIRKNTASLPAVAIALCQLAATAFRGCRSWLGATNARRNWLGATNARRSWLGATNAPAAIKSEVGCMGVGEQAIYYAALTGGEGGPHS